MKRLNPLTNKPYCRGDTRCTNGEVQYFLQYRGQTDKNGYVVEYWIKSEQQFKKVLQLEKKHHHRQFGSARTEAGVRRLLLKNAKTRAIDKKLPYDLDHEFMKTLNVTLCAATGVPLNVAANGKVQMCSPSLDRIDPQKGYTKGNVRVVANMINSCKGSWSEDDPDYVEILEKYIQYLRGRRSVSELCIEQQ
jgi:hypothetical protein